MIPAYSEGSETVGWNAALARKSIDALGFDPLTRAAAFWKVSRKSIALIVKV